MRQRVGTWGADLSDDEFACAIAAAGIVEEASSDELLVWQWKQPSAPARELLDAWRRLRGWRRTVRMAMVAPEVEAMPYLARAYVNLDGLYAEKLPGRTKAMPERWVWPWQVVDASVDHRFSAALSNVRRFPRTIQLVDADERKEAGLLIVNGPIANAEHLLAERYRYQRAQIVLVTGPTEVMHAGHSDLAGSLADRLGAAIVITEAPTQPDVLVRWLELAADELAHDNPIDVALLTASRRLNVEPATVIAEMDLPDRARLSKRIAHLVARIPAEDPSPFESFDSVRPDLDNIRWDSEGQGATALALLGREQRDRDDNYAVQARPRYLQANLTPDGAFEPATTVAPDRTYHLAVRIGNFDPKWLAVPGPISDPTTGTDEEIEIVVSERNLLAAPQRATMTLPPRGETKPVYFTVITRADVERLELRVTALHRNRVLQSGILRARIDGADTLVFDVDAIARHQLAGLDCRRRFDAAIVANHTLDGQPGFLGVVPDNVGYITLATDTLKDLRDALGRTISKIAADPAKYRELRSDGTVKLLRNLAVRGAAFYDVLARHNQIGKSLLSAKRIQVVAAREGTFLPVELAYTYPPPDDDQVPLCEHAEVALKDGACPGACGAPSGNRICPLGFWSLSTVIERQAHKPEHTQLAQRTDFELVAGVPAVPAVPVEPPNAPTQYSEVVSASRAVIAPPRAAVAAFSKRIDDVVPTTSQELLASLAETFGGAANVSSAADWQQWASAVTAASRPSLLVLLPHHKDGEDEEPVFEIGDRKDLAAGYLRNRHVTGDPSTRPSPIVLLLGCATEVAQIPYESFVAAFRRYDAAVVISTISTVLGRDAAPVAAAFAQALIDAHRQGGGYLGEVMMKVRRKMLLDGKAMVLALTAYGDADWMLAPA